MKSKSWILQKVHQSTHGFSAMPVFMLNIAVMEESNTPEM